MTTQTAAPMFTRADLGWAAGAVLLAAVFVASPLVVPAAALGLLVVAAVFSVSIRRTELLAAALVATAALDVVGRLGKVAGVTVTVFQAMLLVAFGVALWLVATGRSRFKASVADPFIILVSLAALFAAPAALVPSMAIVALVSLYCSIAVSYFVRILAPTTRQLSLLLLTLLVVASVLGVAAVAEKQGTFTLQGIPYKTPEDGVRARVTFDDPNILGGMLAATAAAALPLLVASRKLTRGALIGVLMLLALAGMVATLSRGAWLGFVAGALVALVVTPMRPVTRLALLGAGVLGAIALTTFVLDPTWIADKVLGVLGNKSALYRVYLIQSGLDIFRRYPFGVGPGMFAETAATFRSQYLRADLANSHTALLTVLVELGVGGFIGFVGTIVAWGWQTVRTAFTAFDYQDRVVAAAAAAGGSALLVQSLTYSLEGSKFLWFFIGVGLAVATASRAGARETKESS